MYWILSKSGEYSTKRKTQILVNIRLLTQEARQPRLLSFVFDGNAGSVQKHQNYDKPIEALGFDHTTDTNPKRLGTFTLDSIVIDLILR